MRVFCLELGLDLILRVLKPGLRGLKRANLGFRLGLSPWDVWINQRSFLDLDYLTHCNWYIYRFCNTINSGINKSFFS